MNYDDDEEQEVQKIKIPKYRVLAQDMDPKMVEKVLECKLNLFQITNIKIKLDTVTSLPDCEFDRDICTKLKKRLDEDSELNQPSITSAESKIKKFFG